MASLRPASLALVLLALSAGATSARAQLVPKAAPTTPVESIRLSAPGDPYPGEAWEARGPSPAVDGARLMVAADAAFSDPPPAELPGTRALLVIHHGALIYERYAEGYGASSRFLSWSMANSFVNAGIGLLVADGKLAIDAPARVPQWDDAPRRAITVRQLLTMTSGLAWPDAPEVPAALAADVQMLFGRGRNDMAAFAATRALAHTPGTVFRYNTGSSLILSSLIARTISPAAETQGARRVAIQQFYATRLFAPLGIKGAVIEFDRAGTFVGGGYVHMSARDYARFGYLYLRDGRWGAAPLLPAGWVDFTRTPGGAENSSAYGAHFWLMTRKEGDPAFAPTLPDEPGAMLASGNNGQAILIVPSRALLIVRLGNSPGAAWPAIHGFLREIVSCFPAT
jgi:CubicO group peptidase (beta-lactamase class C family)